MQNLTSCYQNLNYADLLVKIKKVQRRPTIESIFGLWWDEITAVVAASTATKIRKLFLAHVLTDHVANVRVDKLNPLLVQKILLDPLLKAQKYTTVCSISTHLNAMCNFAVAVGLIKENQLTALKDMPQVRRAVKEIDRNKEHRHSFAYNEIDSGIKHLFKDYRCFENLRCRILLELSFHLLLRPGEMVKIQKSNCDYAKQILIATGTKTFNEFYIPLSEPVCNLLQLADKYCSNERYFFGSPHSKLKQTDHLSSQVLNASLKRCGYQGKLHAHGIRAVFSTWASLHPKSIDYITKEAMLQHIVSNRVERAYRHDRHFFEYRKQGHRVWSAYLTKMIDENSVLSI